MVRVTSRQPSLTKPYLATTISVLIHWAPSPLPKQRTPPFLFCTSPPPLNTLAWHFIASNNTVLVQYKYWKYHVNKHTTPQQSRLKTGASLLFADDNIFDKDWQEQLSCAVVQYVHFEKFDKWWSCSDVDTNNWTKALSNRLLYSTVLYSVL